MRARSAMALLLALGIRRGILAQVILLRPEMFGAAGAFAFVGILRPKPESPTAPIAHDLPQPDATATRLDQGKGAPPRRGHPHLRPAAWTFRNHSVSTCPKDPKTPLPLRHKC